MDRAIKIIDKRIEYLNACSREDPSEININGICIDELNWLREELKGGVVVKTGVNKGYSESGCGERKGEIAGVGTSFDDEYIIWWHIKKRCVSASDPL